MLNIPGKFKAILVVQSVVSISIDCKSFHEFGFFQQFNGKIDRRSGFNSVFNQQNTFSFKIKLDGRK